MNKEVVKRPNISMLQFIFFFFFFSTQNSSETEQVLHLKQIYGGRSNIYVTVSFLSFFLFFYHHKILEKPSKCRI